MSQLCFLLFILLSSFSQSQESSDPHDLTSDRLEDLIYSDNNDDAGFFENAIHNRMNRETLEHDNQREEQAVPDTNDDVEDEYTAQDANDDDTEEIIENATDDEPLPNNEMEDATDDIAMEDNQDTMINDVEQTRTDTIETEDTIDRNEDSETEQEEFTQPPMDEYDAERTAYDEYDTMQRQQPPSESEYNVEDTADEYEYETPQEDVTQPPIDEYDAERTAYDEYDASQQQPPSESEYNTDDNTRYEYETPQEDVEEPSESEYGADDTTYDAPDASQAEQPSESQYDTEQATYDARDASPPSEYQYHDNTERYDNEEAHDHSAHDHSAHDHYHSHEHDDEYYDEYRDYDPEDDEEEDEEYPDRYGRYESYEEGYDRDPVQPIEDRYEGYDEEEYDASPVPPMEDEEEEEDIFGIHGRKEEEEEETESSMFGGIGAFMNSIWDKIGSWFAVFSREGTKGERSVFAEETVESTETESETTEDVYSTNDYMELYKRCNAKVDQLEQRVAASSIVEINMNHRILVTFVFVLMDITLCILCYPRQSMGYTGIWMVFWSALSFMAYESNGRSPLFIVLAVNAAFPLLTKASKQN